MTKTDIKEAQEKAKAQVENTSGGGQLGGTYYGQAPDAKTASTVKKYTDKTQSKDTGH